jgi:hypothetical protein
VGDRSRTLAAPLILVVLFAGVFALRAHGQAQMTSEGRGVGQISTTERAATFAFDPGVAPADRAAFLSAVDAAQPQARALLDTIDGLVDVHITTTPSGTVGVTRSVGNRYSVTVDLGLVVRRYGRRGIERDVLHELGHVVDFALVPQALDDQLDAAVPRGYGCDQGLSGACAEEVERFAESFAKWATGDIGVDLYIGYKVPPPTSLAGWGAPLVPLAAAGS